MSAVPKRPHEETVTSHSTPPKRSHEETINKTAPFDHSQDSARFSKTPRMENREERRPAPPLVQQQVQQPVQVPSPPVPSVQRTILPLPPPSSSAEPKSTKEIADVVTEPVQSNTSKPSTKTDENNTNIRVSNIPTWGFPPVVTTEEPLPTVAPVPTVPTVPVTEENSSTSTKEPTKKEGINGIEKEGNGTVMKEAINRGDEVSSVPAPVPVAEQEKEKEVGFGGNGIQRKRQQRARAPPSAGHRDPRFRSRLRDDGLQGKGDASIVYKAGECMQELLKTWKDFEASQKDAKNSENSQTGPSLEIRIPSEYVISTNRQVKGAQLWGTDIYTNDSDLVAVLMHMGYCSPSSSPPPSAIQELKATIRILPPQNCYTSTLRNNVRSRAWGAGISCSYRVENCFIVKKGGDTIELEPRLQHTSGLEPTLAPVSVERTMTTRSAASNALRQQKFVREVTVQYNLCNEPWLKYSISAVADKGLKKSHYTSSRLKRGEVLYLETHFNRYELSFTGERVISPNGSSSDPNSSSDQHQGTTANNHNHNNPNPNSYNHHQNGFGSSEHRDELVDTFRWARCKKPVPEPVMRTLGIPLPTEHLEILAENLEWEEIQWSSNGVWIGDREYSLARVQFIAPK